MAKLLAEFFGAGWAGSIDFDATQPARIWTALLQESPADTAHGLTIQSIIDRPLPEPNGIFRADLSHGSLFGNVQQFGALVGAPASNLSTPSPVVIVGPLAVGPPHVPDFDHQTWHATGQLAGGSTAGAPAPAASPSLSISFAGASYDSVGGWFPPDCNLAIGMEGVVTVENSQIQWYERDGTLQNDISQLDFFQSVGTFGGDARAVYDSVNDRFVVVTTNFDDQQIAVAVSKTGDPNDGWYFGVLDANLTVNGQVCWPDFPGVATDGEAIYVTAYMVGFDDDLVQESHLWIIENGLGAGGLYDGGAMQVADFGGEEVTGGTSAFFGQPAQILSPTPGSTGMFVVDAWGDGVDVIRIDDPTTAPTFDQQILFAGNSGPSNDARQPGTPIRIAVGGGGNAVWRDGNLYAVGQGGDSGIATAHWFRIDGSDLNNLTVADHGDISGAALGEDVATFYPTIMANNNGDFVVNFSASGPSLYAGAYYALHRVNDPAGTLQDPQALHEGLDTYVRTAGNGPNRWGDYSGIGSDPADGNSFWIFNQYANTQGDPFNTGQTGRWATRVGALSVTSGGVPTDADDTLVGTASPDRIHGLVGNDVVSGASGDDWLHGDAGDDRLLGHVGNDTLIGGTDVDQLLGGAGDDTLVGGVGADQQAGGIGDDTYRVDDAGDRAAEAVGGGFDRVLTSVSYALQPGREIEVLRTNNPASVGAINLVGNEFAQTLQGNAGNNVLNGRGGDDVMQGLGGDDIYWVDSAGDRTIEAVGGGTDKVQTAVSYALQAGREIEVLRSVKPGAATAIDLTGNEFGQIVQGNAGANVLNGMGGNDVLRGLGGADTLVFADGYELDTAADYQAGVDQFDLTGVSGLDSYADVQALMTQIGANVTIDFGAGDTLTILNTTIAMLDANQGDFLL